MTLKYKITLTMLMALNLKLYPMQENINNKILQYIFDKLILINKNVVNNNNSFAPHDILPNEIWQYIFKKLILINKKELQNLLHENIELRKHFYQNIENINRNENKIQKLLKNFINIALTNKNFKELIYPIIKKNFFNKLNQNQQYELLSILIKDKHFKIFVKIILDNNNIKPNKLNVPDEEYDYLPIIIYTAKYKNKSAIEYLIEKGANINIKDDYGETALIMAIMENSTEIAELLIENGADLNIQDNKGRDALMWASYLKNKKITRILIENGANNNNQTIPCCTIISYCTIL